MTVLPFKHRQAVEKPKAKKSIRAKLKLEQLPVAPTTGFYLEDAVRGRLIIGEHTIESLDGNQLGLAAFVANVGSIEVSAPSLAGEVIVLSGSREAPAELNNLERVAGKSMKAKRQRAEYWFLKRLHVVLHSARNSKRAVQGSLDGWEREKLAYAAALVPLELRINSKFARPPGYKVDGSPLTAKGIEQAARNHRVLSAFNANNSAFNIDISWDHISRSTSPHGPVAINGPAYLAVQKMLLKWQFPRMPTSYAELWMSYQYCLDLELLLVAPFGGEVDPEWVKSHSAALLASYPEMQDLFEACVAKDAPAIGARQQQRDWMATLSAYFVETPADEMDVDEQ